MSLRKLKWRGIGRLELLAWLNEFLETDYTKIEHLADGIAYCQVFDALYPGKVNLQQLNFQARSESECERNLRILRRTFHILDIKKEVPIRKLVQGVFQEHFELLHWIHDYVHRTYPDAIRSYHGFERRQQVLGQSLSLSQINSANTNLVPKYSNSRKLLRHAYIELPSAPEDGDTQATGVVDTETEAGVQEVVQSPLDDPDSLQQNVLAEINPSLEFVRHSFRSTLKAKRAIEKLDECMAGLQFDGPPNKPRVKTKETPPGNSRVRLDSRRGGSQLASEVDQAVIPDPMMCRCLSDLVECLESELAGRLKDLQYLEKIVEKLMEVQPESLPSNCVKTSTSSSSS